MSRGPIFIGGLAHSGKTPLRIVLGAHPDISMTRRTHLWDRFLGRFGDLAEPRNLERCLEAIAADPGAADLHPEPERLRRELLEGPATYARLFDLLHRHHAERCGKRRWGDQLGGVERLADTIFAAYPSARMIHMIRDPRAGANGRLPDRWGTLGWETARWLASAQLAERNLRRYPGRYRVVRFESLAAEPAETVRELCTFLGERVEPSMQEPIAWLESHAHDEPVGAPGCPTPTAEAFVDRYARPGLEAWGYRARTGTALSTRDRFAFVLVSRPLNRASMTAWRLSEGRSVGGPVEG